MRSREWPDDLGRSGRRRLLDARTGKSAFAWTPVLPEATPVGRAFRPIETSKGPVRYVRFTCAP